MQLCLYIYISRGKYILFLFITYTLGKKKTRLAQKIKAWLENLHFIASLVEFERYINNKYDALLVAICMNAFMMLSSVWLRLAQDV